MAEVTARKAVTTYTLELTEEEARIVADVLSHVSTLTPRGNVSYEIFVKLHDQGLVSSLGKRGEWNESKGLLEL